MSVDPIKAARDIEARRADERLQHIRNLKSAIDSDEQIAELKSNAKRALNALPEQLAGPAKTALDALTTLRSAAHQQVNDARKAAVAGGWTPAELAELGLGKPARKRTSSTKQAQSSTASSDAS
ncbi:hypothetical protein REH65_33320 (plasmid) [Saccharopolyspora sp. ID03-671]|uniref:hypothetical protein n=1 Tax=Saccharopolyspora sp. ID03-671 TaxID=3073066 RepID=UPI0030F481B6